MIWLFLCGSKCIFPLTTIVRGRSELSDLLEKFLTFLQSELDELNYSHVFCLLYQAKFNSFFLTFSRKSSSFWGQDSETQSIRVRGTRPSDIFGYWKVTLNFNTAWIRLKSSSKYFFKPEAKFLSDSTIRWPDVLHTRTKAESQFSPECAVSALWARFQSFLEQTTDRMSNLWSWKA